MTRTSRNISENKMKITKRQLRQIIKEENARLLVEMDPRADADRTLGLYANTTLVSQLSTIVDDLRRGIFDSAVDDGVEKDEADFMAIDAVLLAVADAFQAADMTFASDMLLKGLGK